MRVSTINSATSLAFSRRNKQRNYEYHPQITYDTNKVKKTLLCLAGIGVAGLTVALIKDTGNNSVKTAFNTVKEAAKEAGLVSANLGPRIIRCETAPSYALSAISYFFELEE